MSNKAADKIIESLTQLIEGYYELQQMVADDLGAGVDLTDEDNQELAAEVQSALTTEVRSAIETVLENDEIAVEDLAMVVSNLTEAIEEIDPDVFASGETEEEDDDLDLDEEEDEDLDFDEDLDEDEDD
jgi:hypothetical protein